jgi:hypothetical protein
MAMPGHDGASSGNWASFLMLRHSAEVEKHN